MSRRKHIPTKRVRLEQLERRELLAADLDFMQQNPVDPLDVNDDSLVTALDALTVINEMNDRNAGRQNPRREGSRRFLDVNNDGLLTAMDVLNIINGINRRNRDGGPSRGEGGPRGQNPDSPPPRPAPEFASVDGTGNNLSNDQWGSTGEALERWITADYADGVGAPAGDDRPSAREVSNIVSATPGDTENAAGLSDLTWLFGQFIDHDITLSESGDEAFDILVPAGDPFFDPQGEGDATIDLSRSDYLEDGDAVRQQTNQITAFIDGSVIYGSDQERSDALRTFEGGLLATSDGGLLPFNEAGLANAGGPSSSLFLAGDIRANENAALTALHTVWVREHNRVAQNLAERHPELNDEQLYQRARQFVTAELQAITYNEFLPALLGDGAISEYSGYDSQANPNIANIFSTAAYRFGHTMLSSELLRLSSDGTPIDAGSLALQDAFFNPGALIDQGIDSILLGASAQTAQEVDPYLVDDVRNFLFGQPGSGGFDLASLNIQRGRDHGLPDYNQVREQLGLGMVQSFAEISSDPEIQARLEEAYGDVNSIDPWVGMLAEDHAEGSTLGVTAGTVIARQFMALRDGDRFYYENVFSGRELRKIERTTLADVIERNTTIDFAQGQNVFFAQDVSSDQLAGERGHRNDLPPGDRSAPRDTPPIESPAGRAQAVDQVFSELDDERRTRVSRR